ncbi:MAG: phosphoribosyltransferase [Nitriliruptoraceae bacterium]
MFEDRAQAGRALAKRLRHVAGHDLLVLALPRGGVPVAAEVARTLDAPLDVLGVRKLGAPGHRELAIGAIAEGGVRLVSEWAFTHLNLSEDDLDRIEAAERTELERRVRSYRADRALPAMRGRTVIVVDDGLATGSTATAACRAVRQGGASRLILAVPVASEEGVAALRGEADEVVAVEVPRDFVAVGRWYRDFGQTTDDEVLALLEELGAP